MSKSRFLITPDKFVKYENIDDEFIKEYFKTTRYKVNGQLLTYYIEKYEGRYDHNILKYLENRYSDSLSIKETVFRIVAGVETRPVCKTCGGEVPMRTHRTDHGDELFQTHCCSKCAANDPDVIAKCNTKEAVEKANKSRTKYWLERTGGKYTNPSQLPEIKLKKEETCLAHFGYRNAFQSPDVINAYNQLEMLKKSHETKKKNGSYKKSKAEDIAYSKLCEVFGENDIIRQYIDDRYIRIHNCLCDFYIKSLDMFVEYNGTWTHGGHPFDENNPDDIRILEKWKQKSITSAYYKNAINNWTFNDVIRRQNAEINNLKFVELWNMEDVEKFCKSFETQQAK